MVLLAQHAKKTLSCGVKGTPSAVNARQLGYGQLQQPTYGAFNERVSVDLMGRFKTTQNGNDYIVVMQHHFTKWVEGQAICGKEALTIADAVVQVWFLKHGTPVTHPSHFTQ